MTDPADDMMETLDRVAWWLLKVAAILLTLTLLWLAADWWLNPPPELPPRRIVAQPSEAEKRWLNARFSYHGITSCIHESGEYYFYRDGKKCRL